MDVAVLGQLVGRRYRLVREIGAGTMGAVHEARDEQTGDRVAVKLLRREVAEDPSVRRRFRREATILRSVSHPGVVRILDLGDDDDGRAFTVMELLEGETLEQRLARVSRMHPAEAGALLVAMAEAVAAIHALGVVHGDLKPSNVFVCAGTNTPVKLVDFGLAKVEGLERLTRTGELAGTPLFMAPELFTGEGGREPDPRLDVYALGVIAHLALAGEAPFNLRQHPGQLVFDIVMGRARALPESTPPSVAASVRHAMAPKREERPADARALASEWKAVFAPNA